MNTLLISIILGTIYGAAIGVIAPYTPESFVWTMIVHGSALVIGGGVFVIGNRFYSSNPWPTPLIEWSLVHNSTGAGLPSIRIPLFRVPELTVLELMQRPNVRQMLQNIPTEVLSDLASILSFHSFLWNEHVFF